MAPDVVITDWDMPGLDGTQLTRRIRGRHDVPYPYIMVLTGRADAESARATMEAGADDLIIKPLEPDDLERKLIAARRVTALHRRLHTDARQDALTGIGNRHRLDEDLLAMQARAQRYGHTWCVALIDVDHFKALNDDAGHLEGDDVLRRLAHTLGETMRGGDTLYRFGGEEFLVLLPEQSLDSAARAGERLRAAVEALDMPHPSFGRVTVSVGVAGPAAPGETTEGLIERADRALYRAKAGGRNRVEVAPEEISAAPIRVMVADDDPLMTGFIGLVAEHEPGIELVGTASDADEAIELARLRRPQVVVLDLYMPRGGGTRAATEILREDPATRIVGLSGDDSQQARLDMNRAGAVGYIVKGAKPDEIVRAIRSSARW